MSWWYVLQFPFPPIFARTDMRKFLSLLLLLCLACIQRGLAQETFPKNGARKTAQTVYAFTNASIYTDYQTLLTQATLLVQDDKILACGKDVKIPENAVVLDLKGRFIYPSFIDLWAQYGLNLPKKEDIKPKDPNGLSQSKAGPYHWNESIRPEFNAAEHFSPSEKQADAWIKQGFGVVLSHHQDGIARGTGTLVSLAAGSEQERILSGTPTQHFSLRKGSSRQGYPSSQMGVIALLRQTHYDAQWYESGGKNQEKNLSLHAWNCNHNKPAFFEAGDHQELFRVLKLSQELGLKPVIKGSGDEYQRAAEIKQSGVKLILPLHFPEAWDVSDPMKAGWLSLSELKHWEMAPHNPRLLAEQGIEFAFTCAGLKNTGDFLKQLRTAVDKGLSPEKALKALTATPAEMLGESSRMGALKPGMIANFIISSGDLFDAETVLYQNWIQGVQQELHPIPNTDLEGKYLMLLGSDSLELVIKTKSLGYQGNINHKGKTGETNAAFVFSDEKINMQFKNPADSMLVRLSGWREGSQLKGNGDKQGINIPWTAVRISSLPADSSAKPKKENKTESIGTIVYPFSAYGREKLPVQEEVLFKNATVWTNEKEGILKESDVLIKGGKIVAVGKNLSSAAARVIDAGGLHLTSGIIDEHSHIAISRGVNESGQASTAEVRIGDVVNATDINIYRQLAGGVTAAQLLHGSANPIGGQSALIKLRWGMLPEQMKIENAAGFIKFALGENVKQSNWGDDNTSRFPQTRMGVEALYYDYFHAARAYDQAMKAWNKLPEKQRDPAKQPRRDLDLEALAEILNQQRFISCHSYVQSEINMLMHVADSMNFKVNTFTHILEGYKVADKMKAHGAGASSFSDWWAYKFEVNDAIPYNGAILHREGVLTAFNSDDAEMARRLNQEAAKAVKYGGLSEEEAWKFVTLNPAKLLHLDERMGSIKVGKDADLVLWSDHPLSIYAKARQTWVDGRLMFDQEENQKLEAAIQAERNRLIQKMLNGGNSKRVPEPKTQKLYHCDSEEEDL